MWTLFRRHPWLAQLSSLSRPLPLSSLAVHADWALGALDGLGLGATTMLNLHIVLYTYVHGMAVNLEREAQAEASSGISAEHWMDTHEPEFEAIAASGRYPTFGKVLSSLAESGYDLDLDELFELGLRALIEGFAAMTEPLRDRAAP